MIERIVNSAIAYRGLVIIIVLVAAAMGLWNFTRLPIDAVPDITNVQVIVNVEAQGYTPLEVEQRITMPLEAAMAGMPKLAYTRSLSRYGLSQVTAIFEDGTDIYFARQLVSERMLAVRDDLPAGHQPTLGPVASGLGEIFMFTVDAEPGARNPDGSDVTPTDLRSIHDWIIRPQLLRVPGVVEVNPIGGYKKEILIAPDPAKLLAFGLTHAQLVQAIQANNSNRGAGYIEHNGAQWLMRVPGQVEQMMDLGSIVVSQSGGVPLRVHDVATVSVGRELRSGAATQNGHEVVMSTVFMLIGENSREVARRVAGKLEEIKKGLPEGITATAVYDRTRLVEQTLATVEKNLLEGALLVVAVLFVLLRNVRAALLTAAVIPLAMLLTITGMVQSGLSANLMSLGALDFGLIVDGAVIIVENCLRRLSQASIGANQPLALSERLRLVREATGEVVRPAMFGVFIITAVYIPILTLTGVEGKMFHPMAITVIIALISAMALSLTFVPAGVALLFKRPRPEKHNALMSSAHSVYQRLLDFALARRWAVISAAALLTLFCSVLATRMGSEFIPNLDEGDIAMHALRIPGTSLDQAIRQQQLLEAKVKELPEVERVFAKIGTAEVATEAAPPSVADNFIILKPREQWPDPDKPKARVVADLEEKVAVVPGNRYEFLQPIQMRFNELIAGVRAEFAIKVFGDDFDTLVALGDQIGKAVGQIPGAADVTIEQARGLPLLTVTPDREAMARLGLNISDLQGFVATAVAGAVAGHFYEGDRRADIVVRMPESMRQDLTAIKQLSVPLQGGGYVPLAEVASLEVRAGLNQINRESGKRRVIVAANVRGRDLGSFVRDAQAAIEANVSPPPGYWIEYGGTFQQLASASRRLAVVVPATLLLIAGLLFLALRSIRDAAVIFSGIPLALTGGVLALWFRGIPQSISTAVGFIALSGVAVLNGLVMVSFIRELRQRGATISDAISQGALTRLRPVLMTALVAALGFVPMAFNTGVGSEVQKPLATVVIGGILSSTLLTLLVLPALYSIVHRKSSSEAAPKSLVARTRI